ncbi:MAG: CapA family protein [Lachnospiraceae bacterium]|nr:CapA family protein [Lachnospiraceae bacterium]
MKRKLLCLLICITVIISLAACSKGEPEGGMPETQQAAKETIKVEEYWQSNGEGTPEQPEKDTETEAVEIETEETTDPRYGTVKLSVAGDCLLASYKGIVGDGNFAAKALEHDWGYFFDGVDEIFKADDFTIVNLECVLCDNPNVYPTDKGGGVAYWYIGPTENTNILTTASVEVCSVANNHSYDYGQTGFDDTKQAVLDAGMEYGYEDHTAYLEKDGFTIALICHGLWYEGQETSIIYRIHEAEQYSDFQVVYYHGGTERVNQPEEWRKRSSRKLVEAGADLVIGAHPHVIQPMEEYNGVLIVYYMGYFVFGYEGHPQNRTIVLTSEITLDRQTHETVSVDNEIIPCYIYTGDRNEWQPTIIDKTENEADWQHVMDFMNWKVDKPL